jgi:hypothetical protein
MVLAISQSSARLIQAFLFLWKNGDGAKPSPHVLQAYFSWSAV